MNIDEILRKDIKSSLTNSGLLLFLAGFMLFMGIITGEIFFKKNYNTRDSYISELGAPSATGNCCRGTIGNNIQLYYDNKRSDDNCCNLFYPEDL